MDAGVGRLQHSRRRTLGGESRVGEEISTMVKPFILLGSICSFLPVALGAFAAHGLKDKLAPDLFNVFEVGVRYHLYHAFALFIVAWLASQYPAANSAPAGWLFLAGIVLFSGSLYAMSLTGA